jgi:predicted nicotinamide N-methyase
MQVKMTSQSFVFGNHKIKLFVPDAEAIQHLHIRQSNPAAALYWAKIWPAAKALCSFLADKPAYIQNKTVLELAAGLGMPSLLAANYARSVCCSDAFAEAVVCMNQSIAASPFTNIKAVQYNWNELPPGITADVLLLSDINYNPPDFHQLEKLVHQFLQQQTTIIISTPQRLMAKPFLETLMVFVTHHTVVEVTEDNTTTICSIFVLEQPAD